MDTQVELLLIAATLTCAYLMARFCVLEAYDNHVIPALAFLALSILNLWLALGHLHRLFNGIA